MRARWILDAEHASPELVARLLAWAVERGADEFTLEVMALADTPAATADAFEDAMAGAELPPAMRPTLDAAAGPCFPSRVRRWALDRRTLEPLRRFLPLGAIAVAPDEPGEAGWFEHLVVYRGGEILLAALTHERVAVLEVTEPERDELAALGVVLRAAPRDG